MTTISTLDPIAVAAVNAIHAGRLEELRQHLAASADLATARLGDDDPDGMSRWAASSDDVDAINALLDSGAAMQLLPLRRRARLPPGHH